MRLEARYSRLDRALHHLAFSTIEIQKGLAELEDRIFAKRLSRVESTRPLFITSLPRAGTTLLLDVITSTGTFGSHTYRDMPFLFIPVLWDLISGGGRRTDNGSVERAHGDGMTIGYDSHEAFEEVLWRAYWPHKYLDDRIVTWSSDDLDQHDEFRGFFESHIRKLLMLRGAKRYVSKNNGNISRIPKLCAIFPDARVLVPFRRPVDHTISMWRQHLNFKRVHELEPFTRRYMEDTAHFDFGVHLRPVDFDGWLDRRSPGSPDGLEFWFRYWCAAFRSIMDERPEQVSFVNYDQLCDRPIEGLGLLRELLDLDDLDVSAEARRFRPSNSYSSTGFDVARGLISCAEALHAEMEWESVN